MTKPRSPRYTPAPELPTDPVLRQRFATIVSVLAERETVAGAARTLDLSRNHFQTILHRVITAMITELTPKPAGRPARPAREVELEAENARLKAQVAALQQRSDLIERMMSVVGGIASGRTKVATPRKKPTKPTPEDPEPAPLTALVATMRELELQTALCARLLGVSPSTVRRHRGPRVASPRATPRRRAPDPTACAAVRETVRATHGVVGAATLARQHQVPRRTCAALKHDELRVLEQERKARCAKVTLAAPGLVRGFDAMHVEATEGRAYWLVAADAAVPYRTSIHTAWTYDSAHVVAALRADFEAHGPPLVLRLDRIACQRTADVLALLEDYEVLALHGPPRHARYYGQLERQNREHRAWYARLGVVPGAELTTAGHAMRTALNTRWPRPSLNGCTADQAWQARRRVDIDRRELRRDVDRYARTHLVSGHEPLHARRLAIETALTDRELLTINHGGWC